ncbi:MAG: tetratricopeptide repeat protein [Sporocytophaga sp.]|nr:tetratricopeptide repeat protein [Sporocytophaga sp.]
MRKGILVGFALLQTLMVNAQTVQDASRSIELEQYEKAKKTLVELSKKDQKNPEIAYLLSDVYYQTGNADSAKVVAEQALAKNESPLYYVALGKSVYEGNDKSGENYFEKALVLSKSKDPKVLAGIAEFYINSTKYKNADKAIGLLQTAISKDDKNPYYYSLMGDAYLTKNDGSKAIENFKKALNVKPGYPMAYLKIGNIYNKARNYDEGLKNYNEGLQKNPDYVLFHRQIGDLYYRAKQYQKAIASYKIYVENTDKNAENDYRYASFLFLNENYKDALSIFENLRKNNYQNPLLYRLLGYSYYETGDVSKGLEFMNEYWKKTNDKLIIGTDYEYMGKLYSKSGNDSLAIINYKKAVEKDSSKIELINEVAGMYFTNKQYGKAAEMFEARIAKIAPTAQDYLNLGKAYYYDKNYTAADSAFARIVEIVPTSPTGYLWRARANYSADTAPDKGKAKPYYEKVIELTKEDVQKNKKEITDSYAYLAYYYSVNKDKTKSNEYWTKVLELDPENKLAKQALGKK